MSELGERIISGLEEFLDALKVGGELRTTIRADWIAYMEGPHLCFDAPWRKTPRRLRGNPGKLPIVRQWS